MAATRTAERPGIDRRTLPAYAAGETAMPFVITGMDELVDRDTEWEPHSHPTHELLWNRRGASSATIGSRTWTITPSVGLWIPAGMMHSARAAAGTWYRTAHVDVRTASPLPTEPVAVEVTPLLTLVLERLVDTALTADSRDLTERMVFDLLEPSPDALLVQKGLVTGRDRAKELIALGQVWVNGRQASKPALSCSPADAVELRGDGAHCVSRAGNKLAGALKHFSVSLEGKTVLDVGASTGGFTQCALEAGAAKVYAVDVGRDQLARPLREDPRVENLEQTDIRALPPGSLSPPPEVAVCDVSFISLRLVLPAIRALLAPGGEAVVLIKPQFEAGPRDVGRGGLVKDPRVHLRVLTEVLESAKLCGFTLAGAEPSPIRGGDGNVEYLAWLRQGGEEAPADLPALVRKGRLTPGAKE